MPFRSEKQRRYMWARHPEIAERWTKEYGSKPKPKGKRKPQATKAKRRGKKARR
jgi:hypothetical protein